MYIKGEYNEPIKLNLIWLVKLANKTIWPTQGIDRCKQRYLVVLPEHTLYVKIIIFSIVIGNSKLIRLKYF